MTLYVHVYLFLLSLFLCWIIFLPEVLNCDRVCFNFNVKWDFFALSWCAQSNTLVCELKRAKLLWLGKPSCIGYLSCKCGYNICTVYNWSTNIFSLAREVYSIWFFFNSIGSVVLFCGVLIDK